MLILSVVITAANVQDRDGGRKVLEQVPAAQYPELLTIFADASPAPAQVQAPQAGRAELVICDYTIERTFAWLMRCRRLRADYETEFASSRG